MTRDRSPVTGVRSGNAVPEDDVRQMFDRIAPVYDRMNTLMTAGRDGAWRRAARDMTGLQPGDSVLDVACGTGKLAALLAAAVGPFGRVEAIDLSPVMVERATLEFEDIVQLRFAVANALALPFGDREFDAATIAFGLRNLADFGAGFREMARVVRPGGRVVCLELSLPRHRTIARAYHGLFRRAAPFAGWIVGRQARAYRYLPDSLDGFPAPEQLAETMRQAGLVDVGYRRMSGGAVAVHRGFVPG